MHWTRKTVDPYMIMSSPGSVTPAATDSAQASIVPAQTGVPAGIPVSSAAAEVTSPATSAGHSSRGCGNSPAMELHRSSIQRASRRS